MRKIQLAIKNSACSWMGQAFPHSWHFPKEGPDSKQYKFGAAYVPASQSFPEAPFWCDTQLSPGTPGCPHFSSPSPLNPGRICDVHEPTERGKNDALLVPSVWLKKAWLLCFCALGSPQPPCKAGSTGKAIWRASGPGTRRLRYKKDRETDRPEHGD